MARPTGRPRRGWVVLRWLFVLACVAASLQTLTLLARNEPRLLPVRAIAIDGELHRHSLAVLQETVGDHIDGGILLVDLAAIKREVEALPWIAEVSLRRVWPDRLKLRVVERRPVARWNDEALVTAAGTVFRPDPATIPRGLPRLRGEDRDAPAVVRRYFAWRERLAGLDLRIAALQRDARGAWQMQVAEEPPAEGEGVLGAARLGLAPARQTARRSTSGDEESERPPRSFSMTLGSREVEARLMRFIRAYPALRLTRWPVAVDLRYANGFAVRWGEGAGAMRSAAVRRSDTSSRDRS